MFLAKIAVLSDRRSHGFLFSQGTVIPIDVPGASLTVVRGFNDRGVVVGNANFPVGESGGTQSRAFYIDKHRIVTFFEMPGGTRTTLNGVNAQGDIVGSYSADGMTHGFLASGVF